MFAILLTLHSFVRWFVLIALLAGIYKGFAGWLGSKRFTPKVNTLRHVAATLTHIQLLLGYLLYFASPTVTYFRANFHAAIRNSDATFFGLIHILLMSTAVVVVTIASSLAKRKTTDHAKFKTMAIGFSIGLIIICIGIPWPFSPLASRPYLSHPSLSF